MIASANHTIYFVIHIIIIITTLKSLIYIHTHIKTHTASVSFFAEYRYRSFDNIQITFGIIRKYFETRARITSTHRIRHTKDHVFVHIDHHHPKQQPLSLSHRYIISVSLYFEINSFGIFWSSLMLRTTVHKTARLRLISIISHKIARLSRTLTLLYTSLTKNTEKQRA